MHARRPAHSSLASTRSRRAGARALSAGVAQLAEHLFCKQVVGGSSPPASSTILGGLPERPKGAGCKPAGIAYVGSNPTPSTDLSAFSGASAASPLSRPDGSGQVFVLGGARFQALRLSRSVRTRRRARRLVVGVSASVADRDLVFQDCRVDPASAGASAIFPEGARHATQAERSSGGRAARFFDEKAGGGDGWADLAPRRPGFCGNLGGGWRGGGSRSHCAARPECSRGKHSADLPLRFPPAGVAQLVEHQPSKLNVEGSNPFSRSTAPSAQGSATARRIGWPT